MTESVETLIERLESAFLRIEKAYNELSVVHAKEKLELVSELEASYAQNRELEEKIDVTKNKLDVVIARLNTMLEEEDQVDAA